MYLYVCVYACYVDLCALFLHVFIYKYYIYISNSYVSIAHSVGTALVSGALLRRLDLANAGLSTEVKRATKTMKHIHEREKG